MSTLVLGTCIAKQINPANQYDDLIACQKQIIDFDWSHQLWPSQNKAAKPNRTDVIHDDVISDRVKNTLSMQTALTNLYQIEIKSQSLQADLNRMARNTKDPKKLQALFKLLNNNPNTIADCVSRPYLIKKLMREQYHWDKQAHAYLKQGALAELNGTLNDEMVTKKTVIITYLLDDEHSANKPSELQEHDFQYVSEIEFEQLNSKFEYQQLNKNVSNISLQENQESFYFEELISQQATKMTTKKSYWVKQNFEQWWQANKKRWDPEQASIEKSTTLKLPAIRYHQLLKTQGAANNEFWVLNNIPIGREQHSAIWTGTEMIIWGGRDRSGLRLNSGSRYNPSSDTWNAITFDNAPQARVNQHAFWTGIEMLIWGGNVNTPVDAGGKYDPITNSWSAISETNSPVSSNKHSAIWTGDTMLVWGNDEIISSGEYNPENNTWSTISTTNQPGQRTGQSAVWTGTDMIIWGGRADSTYLNSGSLYNLKSNSWTDINQGNSPMARYFHTATWSGNQMIILGGYNNNLPLDAASYNPADNTWDPVNLNGAPDSVNKDGAVWLGFELLVWTGDGSAGAIYTPASDNWTPIRNTGAPRSRNNFTTVWTGDEVIIWGGKRGTLLLGTGGKYNPQNDQWQPTFDNNSLTHRYQPTSIWTGNEMIIWGGRASIARTGGRYNPTRDTWIQTSRNFTNTIGYYRHSSVWTGVEMIVWGGTTGGDGNGEYNTGARYNPLTDAWTPVSITDNPQIRAEHTAVWTGDGMIIWGGQGQTPSIGDLNDGGIYDPSNDSWSMVTTTDAPFKRNNHRAVWTGDEMIIWGGSNNIASGGRYDPINNSWSNMSATNQSTVRYPSAVWTGEHIIFWSAAPDAGKLYEPSNDNWLDMSASNEPIPDNRVAAVWTAEEMIVWGGFETTSGGKYNPINDQWSQTNTNNTPHANYGYTSVWSGSGMIIWGGSPFDYINIFYPDIEQFDLIFKSQFEH